MGINIMKMNQHNVILRASAVAVRGTLLALAFLPAAHAADTEISQVTQPTNTLELGAVGVSRDSYAFGNYTGLNRQGVYGNANFDLRGGDTYNSGSAQRWRIIGNDLGLDSRSITGEVGDQGKFRFNFGYDQLPRLRSDSFQTPFTNPGSANLTLPAAALGTVDPTTTATTAPALHDYKVRSERQRYDLGMSVFLAPQWEFKASFRRDDQSGARLTGSTIGGSHAALILPAEFSTKTDQFKASIGYTGTQGRFNIGYSGSLFHNNTAAQRWDSPYSPALYFAGFGDTPLALGQMGSAPSNQAHHLSLSGGYNFSRTTQLTLSAAHGRLTQNQAFLPLDSSGTTSPANPASANAKVITTALNLKLTARPTRDLRLTGAYKYDDRDNQTPVSTYDWVNTDRTLGASNQNLNRPYSRKLNKVSLEADYALPMQTWLKGGFDRDAIKRTYTEVNNTTENSYRLELRNSASEVVSGRLGYVRSVRKVSDYDELASYKATYTAADVAAATPPGFLNLPGLRRFYIADRDRDQLRAAADFTASDALSFQTGLDYNRDNYAHSPFGLKEAKGWTLNLGANYAPSETFSVTGFYTYEDIRSRNDGRSFDDFPWPTASGSSPFDPAFGWMANHRDRVQTFGAGLKYKQLMAGKLDLGADLVVVHGATMISPSGQDIDAMRSVSMPDVISRTVALKLNGVYTLDKSSSIRAVYAYQRLQTKDWSTEGIGAALPEQMIGTNQVSPNYSVHVIGISYIYSYR